MGILRHRRRRISAAFLLLFFFSALGTGLAATVQELEETSRLIRPLDQKEQRNLEAVAMRGRRLIGPGSSPPTCRARCGRCLPCQPVHVTIQPGRGTPLEYYPEAWRCKCGDKLFMP